MYAVVLPLASGQFMPPFVVVPAAPVAPVAPAAPAGPVAPVGPAAPALPVAPVAPAAPALPAGPVAPVAPVNPVPPVAPVAPAAPAAPAGPVAPVAPAGPLGPVAPVGPPAGPDGPVAPVAPVAPARTPQVPLWQLYIVPSGVLRDRLVVPQLPDGADVTYRICCCGWANTSPIVRVNPARSRMSFTSSPLPLSNYSKSTASRLRNQSGPIKPERTEVSVKVILQIVRKD